IVDWARRALRRLNGSFMQTVIILIHLMIVLAMVGLVLLQKSEGGGLGMGGGAGFMSNRGTANVLTRATAILAALFFATSLVLSIIAGLDRKPRSILDNSANPAAPATGGGVLDRLKGGPPPQQAPAAPQVPAGPQ